MGSTSLRSSCHSDPFRKSTARGRIAGRLWERNRSRGGGNVDLGRVSFSFSIDVRDRRHRGAASASEQKNDEAAIARIVRDSICWALTKDRALQESTMAHDEDLFIVWTNSGPRSRVERLREAVRHLDGSEVQGDGDRSPGPAIHLSRSGDVAWFDATLDDLGEWDGKPTGARDIRWTGVLEKREGSGSSSKCTAPSPRTRGPRGPNSLQRWRWSQVK